jgi:hypothetical protein
MDLFVACREGNRHRIRLGGRSFQKLKQPLRDPWVFGANRS